MAFELINIGSSLIQKQAVLEVLTCNDFTTGYGLYLTEPEARELVETRSYALKATGRVEFGGGALDKIIKEFCDSPYLSTHNYLHTLHELTEIFYYYKSDTSDQVSDDDLIKFMHKEFDGSCHGSLELLGGRTLAAMAKNVHCGLDPYTTEEDEEEEEDEDGAY